MSVNFTSVGATYSPQQVREAKQVEKTNFAPELAQDTFEAQKTNSEKTLEQKQELVKKARKQGAAWSILGGLFTTAYYALRSDDTVAKKFDLDTDKDKNLIKKIKQEQTLYSLSGGLGHLLMFSPVGIFSPLVTGGIGYLISSVMDSNKIDLDKTL